MALLTNQQKLAIYREVYERFYQGRPGSTPWTKTDWQAAMDAINNWIDANLASFQTALAAGAPGFNATATPQDKALLFVGIVVSRAGVI